MIVPYCGKITLGDILFFRRKIKRNQLVIAVFRALSTSLIPHFFKEFVFLQILYKCTRFCSPRLPVCQPSICLFIHPFTQPSICPSIYPSILCFSILIAIGYLLTLYRLLNIHARQIKCCCNANTRL